jgi:hypothetical protein
MTATSGAMAGEATLGDVSINLPPPAGFCEMAADHPGDSRSLTSLSQLLEKSGNKLLSVSADCGQLADWRAGKRQLLDDTAQYQTRISVMDKSAAAGFLARVCNTVRTQGNSVLAKEWPNIKARIESALQKVTINQPSDLGVLDEDAKACYGGLIIKSRTEAGTDKTVAALGAMTVVRSRFLYFWRYTVYHDEDTVKTLLAKQKRDVAALIAANL